MKPIRFVKSATAWDQFPPGTRPQVAIAGRSNSGKSSLINSLAGSKVAKVSGTPGKTRFLNIFDVGNRYWLVDMPGYGYGARSHRERAGWEPMIEDYLSQCESLKGLILLMDIRRDWSEEESLLMDFCKAMGLGLVVGLTKADKWSRSRWKARVLELEKGLEQPVYALSSTKNWGASELMGFILKHWV